MAEPVIACFCWHDRQTRAEHYLEQAECVREWAQLLGGRLISWGADRYAIAFPAGALSVVLPGVLELARAQHTHSVGITARALSRDQDDQCWGPGLVVAEALALAGRRAEVLVDPMLEETRDEHASHSSLSRVEVGAEIIQARVYSSRSALEPEVLGSAPLAAEPPEPETVRRPELEPGVQGLVRAFGVEQDSTASEPPEPDLDSAVPTPRTLGALGSPAPHEAPSALVSTELQSPEPQSPGLQAHEPQSPELQSPELQSPEPQSPELQSPELQSPEPQSPELQSPELQAHESGAPEELQPAAALPSEVLPSDLLQPLELPSEPKQPLPAALNEAPSEAFSGASIPTNAYAPDAFGDATNPGIGAQDVTARVAAISDAQLVGAASLDEGAPQAGPTAHAEHAAAPAATETSGLTRSEPPPKPARRSSQDPLSGSPAQASWYPGQAASRVTQPPPKPLRRSTSAPSERISAPPKPGSTRSMPPPKPSGARVASPNEEPLDPGPRSAPRAPDPPGQATDGAARTPAPPRDKASMLDALRRGDVEALMDFAEHLRTEDRDSDLPERLEGMASLARGDVLHGLLHLRQAVRLSADSAGAGRTRLALAVGLLKAGRPEDALIESVSALALARRASDERGQHACARLLRQLALSNGYPLLAERWQAYASSAADTH